MVNQKPTAKPKLLRRQAEACEICPHDNIPGKPAVLGCIPIIGLRQWTARNLKGTLPVRSDRRHQMREHQAFRARAFRHRAEIEGITLAIIGIWIHSAGFIRSHNGMNGGVHDNVSSFRQPLDLI
jgi:hypothetical protein